MRLYRLLTGGDDAASCKRVSEALKGLASLWFADHVVR